MTERDFGMKNSKQTPAPSPFFPLRLPLFALCVFLLPLPSPAQNAYTNHAGLPVPGIPIALDDRTVTLSNATEVVTVPLSIFPDPGSRPPLCASASLRLCVSPPPGPHPMYSMFRGSASSCAPPPTPCAGRL